MNNNGINRGFDFIQSGQGKEDPPSKLIGQFLYKQKALGEMSLDMDLGMDELYPNHWNMNLSRVFREAPDVQGAQYVECWD